MLNLGKQPILGTEISAVDYEYAVSAIMEAAKKGEPLAATALAVHGVVTSFNDPAFRRRINSFDLVLPDGQPVRWALKWLYRINLPDRVYGPILMLKTLEAAAREGVSVYFYGSTDFVLRLIVEKFKKIFPRLIIAGAESSKFRRISEAEKKEAVERINSSKACLLFVGLGCPRQEVWVYEYRQHLKVPIIAVGAAFSYHAGLLRQPPKWAQDNGLEWLFRLIQEPARLWKRYLLFNPTYLILVALEVFNILKVPALIPNGTESQESYG